MLQSNTVGVADPPKPNIAAYNTGSAAVYRYGGVPPHPETQKATMTEEERQPLYRNDAAAPPSRKGGFPGWHARPASMGGSVQGPL